MEPTEEAVVTQLLSVLPTVDTDTATTKDILNLLKEHFGVSVRAHKSRIMVLFGLCFSHDRLILLGRDR